VAEHGRPPSRPELAKLLGISSTNGVFKHLVALARKGALELVPNAARGIRLTEPAGLPLVGRVAAGSPILAIENMLGRYPIDPALFNPRADYLLQVSGLSMRDEGILDGDWLVVHRTTEAKNGQLVVARLGDDVTVKRLKVRGRKAELIPANPDFETLHFDLDRQPLAIEGIAVGVIRNLHARA
jgi:repressor LexA